MPIVNALVLVCDGCVQSVYKFKIDKRSWINCKLVFINDMFKSNICVLQLCDFCPNFESQ